MIPHPESVYATALYSHFNLSNPETTVLLTSTRDHPIRMHGIYASELRASYPLINPMTEAFIAPHSLLWTASGTHFFASSDSLISLFDATRDGSGPCASYHTIPSKRKKIVGGGVGMKGIVGALGLSCEGILAAGTFTRYVGLYGDEGQSGSMGVWSVAKDRPESADYGKDDIGGTGITQTEWSPDGKYLYVAERMSDGVIVYDIRVQGKRLGVLKGRKAMTNQRLGIDVTAGEHGIGHEVWGGGTDGVVRLWTNPHEREGVIKPSFTLAAHDGEFR